MMNEKEQKRISKFMSLVLRHRPDKIGIELDANGWVDCHALIAAAAGRDVIFSQEELEEVVRDNDKQRFALSEDRLRVRASQGHSVQVDLELQPEIPPAEFIGFP